MKKQNLVMCHDEKFGFSYGLWQILQSEHRVFPYRLTGASPMPGASRESERIALHENTHNNIDFNIAEFQPVHAIIIEGYHRSNVKNLTEALDKRGTINVLLVNTDEDIDGVIQSMCNAEITRFETDQEFELLEHVYHLEHCTLTGGNTAYWQELLEESLPFLKAEQRGEIDHVLEIQSH